jgi:hypothetical protein
MACLTLSTSEPAPPSSTRSRPSARISTPSFSSVHRRSTSTLATPTWPSPSTRPRGLPISQRELADAPLLGDLLDAAGFTAREHPGGWLSRDGIYVDIMVPEALAGPGTRAARLGPHGKRAARRAKGLEGALVDRERRAIVALDPSDSREVSMWVAGPGALLVAKIHKIAERVDHSDRVRDKDALDVLRLLRATDAEHLGGRLTALQADDLAASVTTEALEVLPRLFATEQSDGVLMAVRAAGTAEDPATIAGSLTAIVADLRASVG